MYFIREKEWGLLLRGVGNGCASHRKKIPVWGSSKDLSSAMRFATSQKAYRYIDKNEISNVAVVNVFMRPVEKS